MDSPARVLDEFFQSTRSTNDTRLLISKRVSNRFGREWLSPGVNHFGIAFNPPARAEFTFRGPYPLFDHPRIHRDTFVVRRTGPALNTRRTRECTYPRQMMKTRAERPVDYLAQRENAIRDAGEKVFGQCAAHCQGRSALHTTHVAPSLMMSLTRDRLREATISRKHTDTLRE